jgi:hypothetical protein
MKKLVGAVTLAVLSAVTLQPASAQVSLGARGGLSYSHLAGDVQTNSRARFVVGVFAGFEIAENFGVQPELAYAQKGAKTESEIVDPVGGLITLTQTTSIDYLELLVPAYLRIKVNNEKVKPRLYAGPTFGLPLNCKVKTDRSVGEPLPTVDCKDDVTSFDFGLLFGFGLELGSGPGKFAVDLRYELGLANISELEDDPSKKNRSLQILVGYIRDL